MPDSTTDLETRLRRLEDLAEIRALHEAYGYYLDRERWADFASLFAADGQLRLGPVRADGRAEIERAAREQLAGRINRTDRVNLVHLIGSPQVELDGDRATAEVMWTVVARTPDGTAAVTAQGRHLDDLVREGGRWRIKKRRGFQDIP